MRIQCEKCKAILGDRKMFQQCKCGRLIVDTRKKHMIRIEGDTNEWEFVDKTKSMDKK